MFKLIEDFNLDWKTGNLAVTYQDTTKRKYWSESFGDTRLYGEGYKHSDHTAKQEWRVKTDGKIVKK